jgi:hypothetical protein
MFLLINIYNRIGINFFDNLIDYPFFLFIFTIDAYNSLASFFNYFLDFLPLFYSYYTFNAFISLSYSYGSYMLSLSFFVLLTLQKNRIFANYFFYLKNLKNISKGILTSTKYYWLYVDNFKCPYSPLWNSSVVLLFVWKLLEVYPQTTNAPP